MNSPTWAHRFDVEHLQAICDVFAAHDGDLVRGAFTAVTRPTVADWLARRQLDGWPHGPLVVSSRNARNESVKDFTGRPVVIVPPGALSVKRVAFAGDDQRKTLAARLRRERVVLFEGWAESEAHRQLAADAGLRRVGTKVRSSSELIGLWSRGCRVIAREECELWTMRRAALDFDVSAAVAELSSVGEWVDHYSNYNEAHSWHAVALRSYGGAVETIEKPPR